MAKLPVFNIGGLNLKLNPFQHQQGELIRAVNVDHDFYGAKVKRPGYIAYLNDPDNAQVNSLFNWTQDSGTQFWNYRFSGSVLYYSTQGTGNWTVCGNGTFAGGGYMGNTILENTLIIGNGVDATRHTTNGTSFTNTTSAPVAEFFEEFQQRVYALGTTSNLTWSTTGTPTDWTSDSSSIQIPGPGGSNGLFKQNNRLIPVKNSGVMFKYDGDNLFDLATGLGPSSPQSIGNKEDIRMWGNREGIYSFSGVKPKLMSNSIERQIYNKDENGIPGANFDRMPGVFHRYDYYLAVGTVTDDLTDEVIDDAIIKYNLQTNEFVNWKFSHFPTAFGTFNDVNGDLQLIFGDANGETYQLAGTANSDAGNAIGVELEGYLHLGEPSLDKEHKYISAFSSPGARAKIQVAMADTFDKSEKGWIDLGDLRNGHVDHRFSEGSRSKFLFWRVHEYSKDPAFRFFGFEWEGDIIPRQ